jgi:hypothetical protein
MRHATTTSTSEARSLTGSTQEMPARYDDSCLNLLDAAVFDAGRACRCILVLGGAVLFLLLLLGEQSDTNLHFVRHSLLDSRQLNRCIIQTRRTFSSSKLWPRWQRRWRVTASSARKPVRSGVTADSSTLFPRQNIGFLRPALKGESVRPRQGQKSTSLLKRQGGAVWPSFRARIEIISAIVLLWRIIKLGGFAPSGVPDCDAQNSELQRCQWW